jgi:hypothetical protein
MAENKKSFVFYCDWIDTFKALPKDKGYDLLMHLLSYVNDENPKTDDVLVNAVFQNIKNALKRDLKKYEVRAENSRENGKLGGRPKKPKKPSGLIKNPTEPKKPDSVNVSDSDNVINIPTFEVFLSYAQANDNKISPLALKHKYEAWVVNGWKDGKDNAIKNWKVKLLHTLQYIDKIKEETTWQQTGLLGNQ